MTARSSSDSQMPSGVSRAEMCSVSSAYSVARSERPLSSKSTSRQRSPSHKKFARLWSPRPRHTGTSSTRGWRSASSISTVAAACAVRTDPPPSWPRGRSGGSWAASMLLRRRKPTRSPRPTGGRSASAAAGTARSIASSAAATAVAWAGDRASRSSGTPGSLVMVTVGGAPARSSARGAGASPWACSSSRVSAVHSRSGPCRELMRNCLVTMLGPMTRSCVLAVDGIDRG